MYIVFKHLMFGTELQARKTPYMTYKNTYKNFLYFIKLEICFPFLIPCWPIRARDVSHSKITKK